jgi:hypothetical protein
VQVIRQGVTQIYLVADPFGNREKIRALHRFSGNR